MIIAAGVLSGAGVLALVHRLVPHEHFALGREGPEEPHVRSIWLFVLAITLQNVPEGLAVAAGLTAIGYAPTTAFLLSLGTGLLEAIGALVGAAGASLAGALLPFALACSAGAMLFGIASEIIPETAREETKLVTTFALITGFPVMTSIDIAIG